MSGNWLCDLSDPLPRMSLTSLEVPYRNPRITSQQLRSVHPALRPTTPATTSPRFSKAAVNPRAVRAKTVYAALAGRASGSNCLLEQFICVDHKSRSQETGLNVLSRSQENLPVA
jgi:hypothetical protein